MDSFSKICSSSYVQQGILPHLPLRPCVPSHNTDHTNRKTLKNQTAGNKNNLLILLSLERWGLHFSLLQKQQFSPGSCMKQVTNLASNNAKIFSAQQGKIWFFYLFSQLSLLILSTNRLLSISMSGVALPNSPYNPEEESNSVDAIFLTCGIYIKATKIFLCLPSLPFWIGSPGHEESLTLWKGKEKSHMWTCIAPKFSFAPSFNVHYIKVRQKCFNI